MSQSYKRAGVDIEAGNRSVEKIKALAAKTFGKGDLAGIGGFSSAYALDMNEFTNPVLVSGTDGVGTKLLLTLLLNRYDTIGVDLVAMCANDLLTSGARPLFFQDYIACSKVEPNVIEQIVKGIGEGCAQCGCSLNGGEVAEMPDLYGPGHYDLAGFCVGAVERDRMLNPKNARPGDLLVGLASSGIHSNGLSLARKALGITLRAKPNQEQRALAEELLIPTRIYVRAVRAALQSGIPVKSLTHVTGGGFYENLPRSLPENTGFAVTPNWEIPQIFHQIQTAGNIPDREMFTVFNMGIGLVAAIEPAAANDLIACLNEHGENARVIGSILPHPSRIIDGVDGNP